MADNASITILRNTKANIDAEPIKDGNILFTTDQAENKIYTDVGTERIKIGGTVDVDTELSTTSINPVQNKVITERINSIQSQIVPTASIEVGETASKAYSVGDFLVKDGTLYKVTNAIAKGDSLTVGDNIASDTLGGEITSLSEKIPIADTYITNWNGKSFYFYKYGHIVVMTSPYDIPEGYTLSAGETNIFTVPEEFRPSHRTYGYVGNRNDDVRIFVQPNGNFSLYVPNDMVGRTNLALACVYYVE